MRARVHERPRRDQLATAIFTCAVGLGFVTAGLIAWVRRPRNGSGKLMTLVGLTSFLGALAAANDGTLFTIGLSLRWIGFALFIHFVLAFPAGRLEGTAARATVAGTWALVTLGQLASLLVTPARTSATDGADCPPNRLLVDDSATGETVVNLVVQLGSDRRLGRGD